MVVKFDQIQPVVHPNFKGGEKNTVMQAYTDGVCKIMQVTLESGATIGLHTHETNCEIIYVISGVGTVLCDGEYETVLPGQAHYCPKGHEHSLMNRGEQDLVVFAVVPELG